MADLANPPVLQEYRMSAADEERVAETLRVFSQLQLYRNTFAAQWEEAAELILPTSRNTFMYGNYNWPGQKKTDRQIDATGALALHRFKAIVDSLTTPRNSKWHGLQASDPLLMKNRQVRLWFEDTTNRLFRQRYTATANFSSQNSSIWESLGAFGNGGMFVDKLSGGRGLRYKSIPLGELFFTENHQGQVDGFVRWFRLSARQALQKWGADNPRVPAMLREAAAKNSEQPFNFLHHVGPRSDYDPGRLDSRRLGWFSRYVSLEGRVLLQEEGGYSSMPMAVTRYDQYPGETYGRGPAQIVLPSLKTSNAQKRVFLKQGHRAADPVLLMADDGLADFNMRPGALNKGGMTADGKPLIGVLPTGNIQISKEMMQEERQLINDVFLVTLFQILTESPQMTATEVIERINEKGILIAPTVGRQQDEYVGPLIHRELDVMAMQGLLLPMPPALREAKGEYEVVHTSPLAKAMRAQEAAGFMRTLETVKELVQITQDASLLDPFDFDRAVPDIADIQSVPPSWMASPDKIMAKRQQRAQAQARQQQIQAAPAQAAMMKAQAAQAKAGMGQPQQPSPEQGIAPASPLTNGPPQQ